MIFSEVLDQVFANDCVLSKFFELDFKFISLARHRGENDCLRELMDVFDLAQLALSKVLGRLGQNLAEIGPTFDHLLINVEFLGVLSLLIEFVDGRLYLAFSIGKHFRCLRGLDFLFSTFLLKPLDFDCVLDALEDIDLKGAERVRLWLVHQLEVVVAGTFVSQLEPLAIFDLEEVGAMGKVKHEDPTIAGGLRVIKVAPIRVV